MNKKFVLIAVIVVVAIGVVLIVNSGKVIEVNEPCYYCPSEKSLRFETDDGEIFFVCRDCSSDCAWCDNEASEFYRNLLEMPIFVCDECYQEIAG